MPWRILGGTVQSAEVAKWEEVRRHNPTTARNVQGSRNIWGYSRF